MDNLNASQAEAIQALLTKLGVQVPLLMRMVMELAGTVALSKSDPAGYLVRMVDRLEEDVMQSYPAPEDEIYRQAGREMVSHLRDGFDPITRGNEP